MLTLLTGAIISSVSANQNALPTAAPETEGVSRAALQNFIAALDASGVAHSTMVARHGTVIAEAFWEPYTATMPQTIFSVTKTFTALAVGFAVADGLLTVTDRIVDLLPLPTGFVPDAILAAVTVKDLLTMSSGHSECLFQLSERNFVTKDIAQNFLYQPVDSVPGTKFVYNNGASYWLSAIVQRLTGKRVSQYLTEKLFEPIGISDVIVEQSPQRIDMGGFGYHVTTSTLLKLGQFILNQGAWAGKQLLPASWITEMTTPQVRTAPDGDGDMDSDWAQGYGFQMWKCRFDAVRADGAFGQFVIIWPKYKSVIVITAASNDLKALIQIVWDNLSEAFDNSSAAKATTEPGQPLIVTGLKTPTPQGEPTGPESLNVDGIWYRFEDDVPDALAGAEFCVRQIGPNALAASLPPTGPSDINLLTAPTQFVAEFGNWHLGDDRLVRQQPRPDLRKLDKQTQFAASYAWTSPTTLEIRGALLPTVFELTWVIEFAQPSQGASPFVTISASQNVSFSPRELYRATARRAV